MEKHVDLGEIMKGSENLAKQFVKDLKDKDQIRSVFIASDKMVLTDRNGNKYLSVNLKDASGAVNARLWDNVESAEDQFVSGDFVWVKGHVQIFQNRKQIVVHGLRKAEENEYSLSDFIAETKRKPEELFEDFKQYVASFENNHIRQLLENIIADKEFVQKLVKAPAAKTIHHAYLGGLLEHVVSICGLMDAVSSHYGNLNRDLLIFGAIFHDIGKVEELTYESSFSYSDRGRLLGHMTIACEYIDRYSANIEGFPRELKDILKHIILSHHGRLEYGSPKTPAFPEAVVVAMIDDLDSKLNTIFQFMESELDGPESWTRYHQGFDRYFYLDIMKKKKNS